MNSSAKELCTEFPVYGSDMQRSVMAEAVGADSPGGSGSSSASPVHAFALRSERDEVARRTCVRCNRWKRRSRHCHFSPTYFIVGVGIGVLLISLSRSYWR